MLGSPGRWRGSWQIGKLADWQVGRLADWQVGLSEREGQECKQTTNIYGPDVQRAQAVNRSGEGDEKRRQTTRW